MLEEKCESYRMLIEQQRQMIIRLDSEAVGANGSHLAQVRQPIDDRGGGRTCQARLLADALHHLSIVCSSSPQADRCVGPFQSVRLLHHRMASCHAAPGSWSAPCAGTAPKKWPSGVATSPARSARCWWTAVRCAGGAQQEPVQCWWAIGSASCDLRHPHKMSTAGCVQAALHGPSGPNSA